MIQKGYVIETEKNKVVINRTKTGIEMQTFDVDGMVTTTQYTYETVVDMKLVFEMIIDDMGTI